MGFWMGVMHGCVRHHSYQTLAADTQRHMRTSMQSPARAETGVRSGKKSGNQEAMSAVCVAGLMLMCTPAASVASK